MNSEVNGPYSIFDMNYVVFVFFPNYTNTVVELLSICQRLHGI